tara:strand:+ start:67 stop:675 length:609 start_codon:yes stop_codon:yes gene_type:complete
MDTLYNFSNKSDNNNESLKINIDELYSNKQSKDLNILNNYNKILTRIHTKIKYVSKNIINQNHCWYLMPEMLIGIPKYDYKECTAYVMNKLQTNGFVVRYTHPNLLFISWNHWVPQYVRNEIKKQTGVIIDEYGNQINNTNDDTDDNLYDINIINRQQNNKSNRLNKIDKNDKNDKYKDINNYKPSGDIIYNSNLLKKLDIN